MGLKTSWSQFDNFYSATTENPWVVRDCRCGHGILEKKGAVFEKCRTNFGHKFGDFMSRYSGKGFHNCKEYIPITFS